MAIPCGSLSLRRWLWLGVLALCVPFRAAWRLSPLLALRRTSAKANTLWAKHDPYRDVDSEGPEKVAQLVSYLEERWVGPESRLVLDEYLDVLLGGLEDECVDGGLRVLEIGSGTGAFLRLLARRPGIREVVGLEPSAELVRAARELTVSDKEALATGVRMRYIVGGGESIPYWQESFDAVIFHTTLMHISPLKKRRKAVHEASRVLRQGGRLGVFDNNAPSWKYDLSQDHALAGVVQAYNNAWLSKPNTARAIPHLLDTSGTDLMIPWTERSGPSTSHAAAKGHLKDTIRYCVRHRLGINGEIGEALMETVDEGFAAGQLQPLASRSYGFCIGSKVVIEGNTWCDI